MKRKQEVNVQLSQKYTVILQFSYLCQNSLRHLPTTERQGCLLGMIYEPAPPTAPLVRGNAKLPLKNHAQINCVLC